METFDISKLHAYRIDTNLQNLNVRKVTDLIYTSEESPGQQSYSGYTEHKVELLGIRPTWSGEDVLLTKAGLQYLLDNFDSFEINED